MNTAEKLDIIARKVMSGNRAYLIEELISLEDIDLNALPKSQLSAELMSRGIKFANGVLTKVQEADFDSIEEVDYESFCVAAKNAIESVGHPVPTADLIGMVGINKGFMPLSTMSHHLKKHGVHFISGVGYWTSTQFTDPKGHIMGRKSRSKYFNIMTWLFKTHGWPLSGRDIESITKGKITSRWITNYVSRGYLTSTVGIGNSLFVPAGCDLTFKVPMSKNVALKILAVPYDEVHEAPNSFTLHKIFSQLEKAGLAKVSRSATTRSGKRIRTFTAKLTPEGEVELARIAHAKQDEF